ncbi:MAG TPA: hypothetical protein VFE33_32445 [Thermoanaerobaculia bacterium]|nr:hypothetical protein [Thermoanaerobaculia bacterium]
MSFGKILAYDGDCPMCDRASGLAVRLFPGQPMRQPFQSFTGETAGRLDAAGIRNEMAVLDPATAEIRSGIPGFLWLLEGSRAAPLGRLLGHQPFLGLLTFFYRIVSYNRRILAPPRSHGNPAFRCACDPDDRPGYQLALIALLLGLALGLTALFGAAVAAGTGLATPGRGAFQMILAAGSGWVLLLGAAAGLPGELRLRFVGHLGMVMVVGLLVLVPSMLLALVLSGPLLAALFAVSVTASFLLMLRSLSRRLRFLGLSLSWLAGWAAALWAGMAATIWFFYLR